MKTIKIQRLKLTAFKGIKSLEIDFSDQTQIFGANGSGKTTIFDAFTWLLFGKDSTDRKDFEIKTLDEKGNAIPKIDHEVEAIIDIDGELIEIKRIYSEKWVKQQGNEFASFTGHETKFFWNGVPMKQIDFQKEVNTLCPEFIFKLITSPVAFNSLSWKERRNILVEIAGAVSNEEIAGTNSAYLNLVEKLAKYNSEEDYKKMLQASVKKSKEEIAAIPSRIDEVQKGKPTPLDYVKIKKLLAEKESQLYNIGEQIEDSTKAYQAELDKINSHNREVLRLKSIVENHRFEAQQEAKKLNQKDTTSLEDLSQKIQFAKREKESLQREMISLESSIKNDESKIQNISLETESKRSEWHNVNAEECKDSTICPSCEQSLPESKVSEIMERFKTNKSDRLTNITTYGKKLSEEKENAEKRLAETKEKYADIKNDFSKKEEELNLLESQFSLEMNSFENQESKPIEDVISEILQNNEAYQEKFKELSDLESNPPTEPQVNNSELKSQKQMIQSEIDLMKQDLNQEIQIAKANERIAELQNQEKTLAQQIADVDRQIFTLEEFTKLKVDEIENRVRDKFQMVSFRMFNEQINGGLEPTCETLIDGVPFSDANTASKINAGIDIINTLSQFYNVTAPIFLDNRESVTDVIPTEAQLVNLIVSSAHRNLEVQKLSKDSITI